MQIQNYEQLTLFISNIQYSYAWLFKTLYMMVRTHGILWIGSLTIAGEKNQVQLDIDKYMEHLKKEATSDDLEMRVENMQKYISGTVIVKAMQHLL